MSEKTMESWQTKRQKNIQVLLFIILGVVMASVVIIGGVFQMNTLANLIAILIVVPLFWFSLMYFFVFSGNPPYEKSQEGSE